MRELGAADISAMYRPKVDASALLDRLSRQHSPRHFVLFSSITGVLGSRRLAHYAAASAFLDGLAQSRAAAGLPATVIDWGIWSGRLTAADSETRAYISSAGLRPMADETAIRALGQMLVPQAPTRAAVVAADWSLLAAAYQSRAALRLLEGVGVTGKADTTGSRSAVEGVIRGEVRAQISEAVPADRRTLLHAAIRAQVAGVMRLPSPESLDPAGGFFQLGMDSLMSVQLQRRLATALDLDIPPAAVFNHPSVQSLTDHLLTLLPDAADSRGAPGALPTTVAVSDPIAVVGIGCRFPGAVSGPAEFWRLLDEGRDGIVETPAARWDADVYDGSDPTLPGTIASRLGGFLTQWAPDEFDAEFFGISPREAETMDPQQRLLLETAVEALAHAGIAPDGLRSSRTGVFVGITTHDYLLAWTRQNPIQGIDAYTTTGNAANFAAGRISYLLGLTGPSLAVDTACSSSLVALHLAAQALRTGDADTALAAGVNLMLTPDASLSFSRWGMLSPQGRCKTFDADADGFVRGEGCGVVVLKRLADAVRDGDRLLAVLRGTAVNQDGPSSGLTVPSGLAQETVIRTALHRAGLSPDDVDYIEAHGAATALGDPIELEALGAVFGAQRERPLVVGSVKTNLGHLEAAAGIAGFIKTVLALAHGRIPPHLSFRELTPRISARAARVAIPTDGLAWPCVDRPARAGVSSFGASGTNAHVILEAPPPHVTAGRSSVWVFSGQGSQWPGMGQRLLAEEPAFAAAVTELDPICVAEAGFSLQEVITAGEEVSGIDRVQPVLFGMQVALAALWRSRGVQPAAVIGHSMGEVAAAVVAEALTPADGMRVIARRSRLLRTIAGNGAMAVLEHLVDLPDGIEVASYSAPHQVVVSGDARQVENLVDALTAQDVFARLVKVDVASHSPQVDPLLPELAAALAEIRPKEPRVRFHSTVYDKSTDKPTEHHKPAFDAAYWVQNLRCPVHFSQAVSAALAEGHRVFTEISPHPLLANAVLDTAADTPVAVVPTLRRDTHAFEPALAFELPAPKWRRKSYWLKTGAASRTGTHLLLGVAVPLPSGGHAFHGDVGTRALPWLADHQVQGRPVLPAAAYVEMALAATAQACGVPTEAVQLRELALEALLPLAETTPVTTLLTTVDDSATIEVFTTTAPNEWIRHATVRADVSATPDNKPHPLPEAKDADRPVDLAELYAHLRSGGQQHGPAFMAVKSARVTSEGTVVGSVQLPGDVAIEARTLRVHPVLLDAALQLLGAT
ncbi:MAG: type I polyketide synthase, partial [Pseudonocardiaceae bacterium]